MTGLNNPRKKGSLGPGEKSSFLMPDTASKLDKFLFGLENGKNEEILGRELNLSLEQITRIKNLIDKNKHKSKMPKILDFSDLMG